MTIRARIADNMMADGISVLIEMRGDGYRHMMRLDPQGLVSWEVLPPDAALGPAVPTMTMSDDVARTLLDALLRWYQGAEDMRTVRADLLHERGRVDKLTDTIMAIAASLRGPA